MLDKAIIDDIENYIIGQYDNDTLKLIVEYIEKRIKEIHDELEKEDNEA